MTSNDPYSEPAFGAATCRHVAFDRDPILFASRRDPVDAEDSGWTFACGRDEHTDEDWLLVSADRMFRENPALTPLRDLTRGHWAEREGDESEWQVWRIATA